MSWFTFRWKRFDLVSALAMLLLLAFGLVALIGITLSQTTPQWGLVTKQGIAVGIGLALFFLLASLDYHYVRLTARWIYGLSLLLLVSVLIFGVNIRGTRGWFSLGGFNFQPVELVKVGVIVTLAAFFARQPRPLNRWRSILVSGGSVALLFGLTLLQPDFGSALVLGCIWGAVVVAIGLRRSQWLVFIAGGLCAGAIAWLFLFAPYQRERILTFLDPSADPLGAGYNVTQSVIAIGSGGWFGRGLSFGSQSQLKFLPEAHTDFVFAVVAEEFGFIGVTVVLGLFLVLVYRLWRLAYRCRDDFALFFVVGMIGWLMSQLTMNVAMNLGLAPVTGITLPLVSYGGSSVIAFLAALGIAQSIQAKDIGGAD